MKTPKLTFSLLLLIVLGASCKKSDFKNERSSFPLSNNNTAAVATSAADSTSWRYSAQWEVVKQEHYSVYYFKIKDDKITADVAGNGLVLVYKKNESSLTALPVEEKGSGSSSEYFYYQVTEGTIMINVDVYGTSTGPASADSFNYFVITPEQMKSLEVKGYTTARLMSLSYNETQSILANH